MTISITKYYPLEHPSCILIMDYMVFILVIDFFLVYKFSSPHIKAYIKHTIFQYDVYNDVEKPSSPREEYWESLSLSL